MDPKCAHCPLAGSATPCRAQVTGHVRYCELVDPNHPDHDPRYIARLRDGPAPSRAELVAHVDRELRGEVEACPHRIRKPCGGCASVCGPAGRRAGQVVTLQQCLECIQDAPRSNEATPDTRPS
jgi:hypothetical protein